MLSWINRLLFLETWAWSTCGSFGNHLFFLFLSWDWPRLLNKSATFKTTFVQVCNIESYYRPGCLTTITYVTNMNTKETITGPAGRRMAKFLLLSLTVLLYCLGFRPIRIHELDILPSPRRESYRTSYIDRFFGCKRHFHKLLQTPRPRWLVSHL